jgi:membrane protease YdiL (CAAX protease family)
LVASIATIAAGFIAEPINALLPEMPELLKQALEQATEGKLWVSILSVSIFAPLFEEWLCRGLVLRGLLQKMTPASAIGVSAVFFAVLHMNPWQAIPAFILGLLFGYVYYKTGSLKLTMLMHCVNNTLALVLARIPSLSDAETFMDVMSPWAYVCIYIACVLFLAAAIITFRGISHQQPE